MKIDRLLAETIYLLNHGRTSAQVLGKYFEVSTRTIIRDMDTLCMAGIPIVSSCGADGGYEIMDTFKMQQQVAGEIDYSFIVSALQGLATAYKNKDIEATLEKVKAMTNNRDNSIFMDLSVVHENRDINEMLYLLNHSVESKHKVSFLYTNNKNEKKEIEVDPVEMIYKWYNWYLIGYNDSYQAYRMYKILRMDNLQISNKEITKHHNIKEVNDLFNKSEDTRKMIKVTLECKKIIRSKCREYLNGSIVKEYENGDFQYEFQVPEEESFWYGVLLSFGKDAKVIEPVEVIEKIKRSYMDIIELYK